MTEVAVVEGRNRKHAQEVTCDRDAHRNRAHANPQNGQASEVHAEEGQHACPVDTVGLIVALVDAGPGVEPAHEG